MSDDMVHGHCHFCDYKKFFFRHLRFPCGNRNHFDVKRRPRRSNVCCTAELSITRQRWPFIALPVQSPRRRLTYGRLATTSISTSAPTASAVTPMQVRAGSLPAAK
mgnify:CR=1 FL=1